LRISTRATIIIGFAASTAAVPETSGPQLILLNQ
jgi:hypothetical protein